MSKMLPPSSLSISQKNGVVSYVEDERGKTQPVDDPFTLCPPVSKESAAASCYLKHATECWVHCLNYRLWSHPFWKNHLLSNFEVCFEHLEDYHLKGRDLYLENFQDFTKTRPEYRCEIIETHIESQPEKDTATVWHFTRIMGDPPSVQKETAILTYWKWSEGKWLAYKQKGIRSGCFL